MGLNRAFDRPLFVMAGAVKNSGGSINLEKGELALVDHSKSGDDGLQVITTTAGIPKDRKILELRLGVAEREPGRSHTNKAEATIPFSLDEIVGLKVSAPTRTEQSVDEFTLGYDGINPETSFNFKTGDAYFRMFLELSGGAIEYRGSEGGVERVAIDVAIPHCDSFNDCETCDNCTTVDCKEITLEAIARLRRRELSGGKKVEDFIDITPIFSCDTPANPTEIAYNFYCLEVCDTGADEAKALVAAQYDVKVDRVDRKGSISKYQMLIPASAGAPADYDQTIISLIKGCADCPAGYIASPEGVLYTITLEDDGVDASATVQALPGYVAGTSIKSGNDNGVGFYTVILDDALTDAEVASFLATNAITRTATLRNLGKVAAICENGTVTSTAWVSCGTCNVVEEEYTITLPDTECGEDRLAELNERYQGLTVTISDSDNTEAVVTVNGTSGTANVTISGVDYLMTFNTDIPTTLSDFINTHGTAFAILEVSMIVDGSGNLVITGPTTVVSGLSIANVSGDLGVVFDITETVLPLTGGCRTQYTTRVISNMVCDECDDIYKDTYISKAPEAFETELWTKTDNVNNGPNGNCLCGIRFKSRSFVLSAEEALRDLVQFTETSTLIRGAAGYPNEIREGIGRLPEGVYQPKYLSRWAPRTHLAGNLRVLENEGRAFFRGVKYRGQYLSRLLRGETSNMEDQMKQYVQYTLQVQHKKHAQSFAATAHEHINYDIFVEVGKHANVEALLNNLAANAGKATVQAFGA